VQRTDERKKGPLKVLPHRTDGASIHTLWNLGHTITSKYPSETAFGTRHYFRFTYTELTFTHYKNLKVMLRWTVTFLIIALVAALFGFGGIAASAAGIAKIIFFIFLILLVISLVMGRRSRI
jgi:uncharacterized membrane protein YtjA (UPF0391 family)